MPVIVAVWEADAGRSQVEDSLVNLVKSWEYNSVVEYFPKMQCLGFNPQ